MEVHDAQHRHWQQHNSFSMDLEALGVGPPNDAGAVRDAWVEATSVSGRSTDPCGLLEGS